MRIVITGAGGFLAWHLRCYLHGLGLELPRLLDRAAWNDPDRRLEALDSADAVFHLAGVNRANPDEVEYGNIDLAKVLVQSLEEVASRAHVVYSSTTHVERGSAYGNAKKQAAKILGRWAKDNNAPFTNMIIPHIFGEQCRPFYNSAVATFCYQLANSQTPKIENDIELELLHAQDVCAAMFTAFKEKRDGDVRLDGAKISVSHVLEKISRQYELYQSMVIPDLRNRLDLRLFNTLRGYMFPDHYPVELKLHKDARGALFEAVKNRNGGQAFISTTNPGITRGNHFHYDKVERFLVMNGEAIISIRRLFDDNVHKFHVSGERPVYIDMPTLHTHNIMNTGTHPLSTLFWSNEIFNPENPDTYPETV